MKSRERHAQPQRPLKKTLPGRVGREEGVGGGVAEGEDDGDVEEEERGRVRGGDVEREAPGLRDERGDDEDLTSLCEPWAAWCCRTSSAARE